MVPRVPGKAIYRAFILYIIIFNDLIITGAAVIASLQSFKGLNF